LLANAFDHGANALKIWIPSAAAGVVGVTDHVTERRTLAANLASHSHDNSSPILAKINKVSSLAEIWPIRTRFDFMAVPPFEFRRPSTTNSQTQISEQRSQHGDHVFHSRCFLTIAQVQPLQQKQKCMVQN
jgi:hypothetical protein